MYNNFFNDSDEVTDKSRESELSRILSVDSREVKSSINYGSSLNYSNDSNDNYLSKVKKKVNYPWNIESTLEDLYPTNNKINNKGLRIRKKHLRNWLFQYFILSL